MTYNKFIITNFSPFPTITGDTLVIACPHMIHNYGLPYYLEGFTQLVSRYPSFNLKLAIPCQDNVGLALEALEASIKVIYFDAHSPAWLQVGAMAITYGAELINQEDLDG